MAQTTPKSNATRLATAHRGALVTSSADRAAARMPDSWNDGAGVGAVIQQVVGLLRRLLLPALICLTATLGTGLGYLVTAKPHYTAQSALFIEPRQRRVVSEDINASGITDIALFESQIAILSSDTVLRRVVEALQLDGDPEFAPPQRRGPLSQLREQFSGPRPLQEPSLRAIEELAKKTRVRRAQNTYVVTVEASSESPAKAAAIANAILEAYLADQTRAKSESAGKVNALIDARLGEIRAEVRRAETVVDQFRRSSNIVTSEGGLLNEQQLTRLNTELVAVRANVATAKARLDEMTSTLQRGASPDALPEAMASPVVQRLRDQFAAAARREAALSSQLGPRHPLMADARAQVASTRGQIAAELERVARQAETEFQIASGREREIRLRIEELEKEVAATATAQIRLRELEREADASREVLRTFLARAKETQEEQNLTKADARVITPAAVPALPSSPNTLAVLALAGFAGLGLAGLWTLSAALPATPSPPTMAARRRRATVEVALAAVGQLPRLASRGRLPRPFARDASVALADVMSAVADGSRPDETAYRGAVSKLAQTLRGPAGGARARQVVLLVSADRGAGTTTTAVGLAYVEALAGRPTLLIDAASADPKLSAEFAGDLTQDHPCVLDSKQHLLEISARDPRSGLVFLPMALADLPSLTESQLDRLELGLTRVAEDFDLVVIDGGALVDAASAATVAQLATDIVLVQRLDDRRPSTDIVEALSVPRDRIRGVVTIDA